MKKMAAFFKKLAKQEMRKLLQQNIVPKQSSRVEVSLSNFCWHMAIADVYWKKKHYHVGEKVAEVGFVWHPEALYQPNDISIGTSLLQKIPKHINFQDQRQQNNAHTVHDMVV